MKIGVFLSKREPFEGGGYTITQELVRSLIENINLYKLNHKFFFLISNDYDQKISNLLKKNNIKYLLINENNFLKKFIIFISHYFEKTNKILNYFNLIKINNVFKNEKCNKVLFISSEYREKISLPYIATVWDMQHQTHPYFKEVSSYGRYFYKRIVNDNFIKNSNTVIVGTNAGKNEILKYTNFKGKILLLPHPVSKIFFKSKKNISKINKNYFFYPANFWEHKNHENLLKGFKKFLKSNKNFYLVLSGDRKNNFRKINDLIFKLGLSKYVKVLGYISLKKLIYFYDNCNAVIYTSFSGPENLPPLEALARKKKLINSEYPGAKEQLKNFPIYVNPYSPNDIAKAMSKVSKMRKTYNYNKLKKFLKFKNSDNYTKKLIFYLLK